MPLHQNQPLLRYVKFRLMQRLPLVEHRGLEPLTPTLPVLCAPNCANAP